MKRDVGVVKVRMGSNKYSKYSKDIRMTFADKLASFGKYTLDLVYIKSRTTDTQTELFFKNSKLLGLGRQIGPKFYEAFGVFLAKQ